LTAWVRTKDVEHSSEGADCGANVGVQFTTPQLQYPAQSGAVFGNTDGWQQVSVTFDTDDRKSADVLLQLGCYSGTTTGTVYFDDLQLERQN
jgi:hypothetical protein